MDCLFTGKWPRRLLFGCTVVGLISSAYALLVGTSRVLAIGVPLVVVGLYGLLTGRERIDPRL